MAVPDFYTLMLPVLHALAQVDAARPPEIRAHVATACKLSSDQLAERLPSGRQGTFVNRVAWALVYLQRAGMINAVKRGVYRLTDRGRDVLRSPPERIDRRFLRQFEEFSTWRQGKTDPTGASSTGEAAQTPIEIIETTIALLDDELRAAILERVRGMSPFLFERLILSLLVRMGYGGGQAEMARLTPRAGDDGVDGVIAEDALGLDQVMIQAKRYAASRSIGRPDVQGFVGSLAGNGTTKGIFVTTSTFTTGAREYVTRVPNRIILIDGEELARLMIRYDVGVRVTQTFASKDIDENVFEES